MAKKASQRKTVIDLFCGCGGIALGFQEAGFSVLAGVDSWEPAMETFGYNFPKAKLYCKDIKKLNPKKVAEELGLQKGDLTVLVAGPPCQGFSLSGNRHSRDPRNALVFDFVKWVGALQPKVLLMENVLGILSMGGGKIKEMLLKDLRSLGYSADVRDLYAHHYGVPQVRRRAFFLGNRLGRPVDYPAPTHGKERPLKPFLTVGEAISNLHPLQKERGEEKMPYSKIPSCDYQKEMRRGSRWVFNHVASNHADLTRRVIALVPEGGNWRDLPKRYRNIRSFSNTWRRLSSKEPSVTIDTGHRHHFHYRWDRVPTVRESARIQSFPDRFRFCGSKTSQFAQVGNAVPPLLAKALAKELKKIL